MGTLVSGLAIVGSVLYLGAEYLFQTTSSIKMRRYSVRTSLGIASTFAVLYFLNFAYLSISWSKAQYPQFGYGLNSCRTAIGKLLVIIDYNHWDIIRMISMITNPLQIGRKLILISFHLSP